MRRSGRRGPVARCLLSLVALVASAPGAAPGAVARDHEPVVLEGEGLPGLVGVPPDEIVAWRWEEGWLQVPVQVDERARLDFARVYGVAAEGHTVLQYTDPETYAGPDPDPAFDADDELVLLARDFGRAARCDVDPPPGVDRETGVEVRVVDPLTGEAGWAYLFRSRAGLDPAAGRDEVDYDFVLESGSYLATYDLAGGPNPERSRVTTEAYEMSFSDRWVRDELRIRAGGADGRDILDRHRNLFAPGVCVRSEDTFSSGRGAFFANIDGPVRAVRAYMGANSGPRTSRTHWFYRDRHEVRTSLRVHEIEGILDVYDLSEAAGGMRWHDPAHPEGLVVDGRSDPATDAPPTWTLVVGGQGSLLSVWDLNTDIPDLPLVRYYSDARDPPARTCTGDGQEYGSSGPWITGTIPNTDPDRGPAFRLEGRRTDLLAGPDASVEEAAHLAEQVRRPLEAASRSWCASGCHPDFLERVDGLRLDRAGADLVLRWQEQAGVDGYQAWRVDEVTGIPDLRQGGGSAPVPGCDPAAGPSCRVEGGGRSEGVRLGFHRVRALCAGEEGP